MKRLLKMTLIIIAILIALIIIASTLFIALSPQFGASKKEKKTDQIVASKNFFGGAFKNAEETTVMVDFQFSTLKEYFKNEGKVPSKPTPLYKVEESFFTNNPDSAMRFTWFGHSAVLLVLEGKTIFIDPMLGNVPAPHPLLGSKRFREELPMEPDELPFLDAVLISHDHYDHLDLESIRKIKDKTGKFYVPLGVGAHLRSWGVKPDKITELDWWDSTSFEGIKIIAAPARHFSGRSINDRNSTLWCSFILQSNDNNLYFSGDGGYGEHFKQIGDKYGPFDLCFLECGQYNEQWKQIHMMPEEVILANNDLRGEIILPIHWGSFKLALHSWTDPVERLLKKAPETNAKIITPIIGEEVIIKEDKEYKRWWEHL